MESVERQTKFQSVEQKQIAENLGVKIYSQRELTLRIKISDFLEISLDIRMTDLIKLRQLLIADNLLPNETTLLFIIVHSLFVDPVSTYLREP